MPRKPKPRVLTRQVHFFAEPAQYEDLRLLARLAEAEMSYLLRRAVTEFLDRHKPVLEEARKTRMRERAEVFRKFGTDPYTRRLLERAIGKDRPLPRKRNR